jgi:hypothetical protein
MPDVFANDYLDRIMKKTEKSLNNIDFLIIWLSNLLTFERTW